MVISKSNGDEHRTWPWQYDRPRITIAFDLFTVKTKDNLYKLF